MPCTLGNGFQYELKNGGRINVVGEEPEPGSASCPAGFQCFPNAAWFAETPEASLIVDEYGFDGACVPCASSSTRNR